jgi:Ca2+-binding RTX toxin-like protein
MDISRSFAARPIHAVLATLFAFGSVTAGAFAASAAAQGDGSSALISGNTLTITGTNGPDVVALESDGTSAVVVFDNDVANAQRFTLTGFASITVSLGNGDDQFTEQQGPLSSKTLTVDGGNGNDVIQTGDGNDTIVAGNGDDRVDAGRGNDTVSLGNGNDIFVWNPGEGSDSVDGGEGNQDVMQFNGSNAGETMSLSANGAQAVFLRNVGAIRMDLKDIEIFNLQALGGADDVTVDNLEGTSIRQANIDLSDGHGNVDQLVDVVTVNGTDRGDRIAVSAADGQVDVTGLRAETRITGSDTTDRLQVNTLAGNDKVAVGANVSTQIGVAVDLGTGQI